MVDLLPRDDLEPVNLGNKVHRSCVPSRAHAICECGRLQREDHDRIGQELLARLAAREQQQGQQRTADHIHADQQQKQQPTAGERVVRRAIPDLEDDRCQRGGQQRAGEQMKSGNGEAFAQAGSKGHG